jgi:hypothetical protein
MYIFTAGYALPTAKAPARHARGVPTFIGAPLVRRAGPALARRSLHPLVPCRGEKRDVIPDLIGNSLRQEIL